MPERGNVTADSGCHLLNYVGCAVCGAVRSPGCVSMVDRSTEEDSDDDEEIVNFTRTAPGNDAVVFLFVVSHVVIR